MSSELVFLCTAGNTLQATMLRSALEAHGVYVHIEGEHQRGSLGILAAYQELRVLVPEAKLELASDIARDVVGELEHDFESDADERFGYRDERDSEQDGEEPEQEANERAAPKQWRILFILAWGMAWGTVHHYAERPRTGNALLGVSALALIASLVHPAAIVRVWSFVVLCFVYPFDLIAGGFWIWRHNRRLQSEQASR